ncbi:MAG: YebC/PmpR family DNA-binding transcriptional regulator [Candidatus Babeliales bacterium]
MAGHSKWANIKHRKAAQDAKRGKIFTRLVKEITVAAKTAGGDPATNIRLRTLIEKAKEANMPLDNLKRAIQKGTGELPGTSYEEYMYEGYGPHGMAVIVEVLTDNKNRAVADVRHAFTSKGGSLAEGGAVSWMFSKTGVVRAQGSGVSEDDIFEKLLDYDVADISHDEDTFEITCNPRSLEDIKAVLTQAGLKVESAEMEWVASNKTSLSEEQQEQAFTFLNALENLDDVQNVYTNLE